MDITEKIKNQKQSVKPFVYNRPSISLVSIKLIILLSLQVLLLLLTKSYRAFFVVCFTVLGSVLTAVIAKFIYKKQIYHIMSIIIQGLFIGLLLPEDYPFFAACFISFCTLFIACCIVFKNINSWVNVSVFAVIIAWVIGRQYFPSFVISSDLLNLRNSSVYLIQNGSYPVYGFDSSITEFLNSTVLSLFKVSIPDGFISMLCDTHSTIPAFRFNLLTIVSSIVIFSDNSFSGIIPSVFLAVYALLVRLFVPFMFGGPAFERNTFCGSIFDSVVWNCAGEHIRKNSSWHYGGSFCLFNCWLRYFSGRHGLYNSFD